MIQDGNGQYRAKLRVILRSALASKRGANELLDAIIELQAQHNALLAKLNADIGVTDTNYVALLAVTPIEDYESSREC
jgi:hypothetical protein